MHQKDSCTFEPFKVIQEELILGNAPIDPVLQDNVLLPKDFTKSVYHVGKGKDLRSIARKSLVPGGFSTKTSRYAVFFTVVDPMDGKRGLRETFCDLSQTRIALHKNTWKHLQNTKKLVQCITCSRKRTAILPNKV